MKDFEHALRINQLVRLLDETGHPNRSKYSDVDLHLIAPPASGAGVQEFLDFDEAQTSLLIAQGRDAGKAAIARWRARTAEEAAS